MKRDEKWKPFFSLVGMGTFISIDQTKALRNGDLSKSFGVTCIAEREFNYSSIMCLEPCLIPQTKTSELVCPSA